MANHAYIVRFVKVAQLWNTVAHSSIKEYKTMSDCPLVECLKPIDGEQA